MPRRGKEKSALAPMKEIFRSLELDKNEASLFKGLTFDFLTRTKKLQEDDIIAANEKVFYKLARELLEREITPGKGPTGSQYWPINDKFEKTLTYAADPTRIIKLVSYIMCNHRRNLLKARARRRRQNPANVEKYEPESEPGTSRMAGAYSRADSEPAIEEREPLTEASREPSEFPSAIEIIMTAREAQAAPNLSDSIDSPSHLATPPITPALSSGMQRRQIFQNDSPHPSIEGPNMTAAAPEAWTPQQSLQPATDHHDRRRERSLSAFAEYNPRLPTHRDGTLDEARVKSWKDGVQFVKDRMEKFNRGLRKQRREHPSATLEEQDAAQQIDHKIAGLDEFVEFLDNDLQRQQKRLKEFKASRATLASSEERGVSRTLSP